MPGVPKELIEHALKVNPNATPKKQQLRRFSLDKREAIKKELAKLLATGFIKEVYHLLTQKSIHWNPRASVRQARKIDQAYQSIWPVDWQGDMVNIKFKGVSAGVPIIPQIGVSASFADTIHDKRIFKCKRVINECIGRISRCTRRQKPALSSRLCVCNKI